MNPLVSVLLPVYNGEPYLRGAIELILNQTYSNLELIIINDGSKMNSRRTIQMFTSDPRVRVYEHPNCGLPATLNHGIELAQGELIARMDQDDLSAPERLEKQVTYLIQHPKIGVLGTSYRVIDIDGGLLGVRLQLCTPAQVRWQVYAGNPFCHGSVMFRKSVVIAANCYEPTAKVEDYDLWSRMAYRVEMTNMPDVLYDYRINVSSSMVATNHERYRLEADAIRARLWNNELPPHWGVLADKGTLRSESLSRVAK